MRVKGRGIVKIENIVDEAEELGWRVDIDVNGYETELYLSHESPAGEDFGFYATGNTSEEIARKIREYYYGFDQDEHIDLWIHAKESGTSGVPSYRVLVNDAAEIEKMLEALSDAMGSLLQADRCERSGSEKRKKFCVTIVRKGFLNVEASSETEVMDVADHQGADTVLWSEDWMPSEAVEDDSISADECISKKAFE